MDNLILSAVIAFVAGGGFVGWLVYTYYHFKYADFIAAQKRFETGLLRRNIYDEHS